MASYFPKITQRLVNYFAWPVGSEYVQHADETGIFLLEDSPAYLLGGVWEMKFHTEGVFHRTEGGNASMDRTGGVQEDLNKEHRHFIASSSESGNYPSSSNYMVKQDSRAGTNLAYLLCAGSREPTLLLTSKHGGAEARPKNRLKRIYKKRAH